MKWIKSRNDFLTTEAKLGDVIFPRQKKQVISKWGVSFLDLEEIEATENIKQGKWKLSDEDKMKMLSSFFGVDLKLIYDSLSTIPEEFNVAVNKSIDIESLISRTGTEKFRTILNDFDIRKPTIDQLLLFSDSIFKKIAVSEQLADEVLVRDESGRPVMEDEKPVKRKKEEGEIIFTSNLVNLYTFAQDYNRCFKEQVNIDNFNNRNLSALISIAREDYSESHCSVDFNIFSKDMYLSISHNPKDILNMSVTKFYSSCQQLYTGGYNSQVLGNVFDPNSIPAFIIFDTPILYREEVISDQVPLCRMMIRNIESFNKQKETKRIFFDRSYPDRVRPVLSEIITKYSENVANATESDRYIWSPDIPKSLSLSEPYMDRLSLDRASYIGVNTKHLNLSIGQDWSRTMISPKAKIDEIIISTVNLPDNFFESKLSPNWIKFKYIKLNNIKVFKNISTSSVGFDKCKLNNTILEELKSMQPNIKNLQIIACDVSDIDLSIFNELDEVQLIYTIDSSDLSKAVSNIKTKKLVLSGDVVSSKENKKIISDLKKSGIKIEIVGPVI